jgi:cytochrome P450
VSAELRPDPAELLEGYDPFDEQTAPYKWEILAHARRECPVPHVVPRTDPDGGYRMITRYRDVRYVLEHPELFASAQSAVTPNPVRLPPLDSDPPLQQEFRKLLNPLMSRSSLLRFEPQMREIARAAIEGFIDDGRLEFVSQFAIPFSAGVLSRVIFDESDQQRVQSALEVVAVLASDPSPEAFGRLAALAGEYISKRAASTGSGEAAAGTSEDILTALVTGTIGGRPLTEEERVGVVTVLFLAGLDTTRGALGNIAAQLARDPDLERRLRDPQWIRRDMDEFLRFESPVAIMARTATAEVEVGGHRFTAGDRLLVNFGSANRDDAQFADGDRLDFELARPGNVAFGLGIHRCLGSNLARLQLEIGWDELLRRVTGLRFAEDGYEVRYDTGMVHGPTEIPLVFDRTDSG